jgi:hypothetical protein
VAVEGIEDDVDFRATLLRVVDRVERRAAPRTRALPVVGATIGSFGR